MIGLFNIHMQIVVEIVICTYFCDNRLITNIDMELIMIWCCCQIMYVLWIYLTAHYSAHYTPKNVTILEFHAHKMSSFWIITYKMSIFWNFTNKKCLHFGISCTKRVIFGNFIFGISYLKSTTFRNFTPKNVHLACVKGVNTF